MKTSQKWTRTEAALLVLTLLFLLCSVGLYFLRTHYGERASYFIRAEGSQSLTEEEREALLALPALPEAPTAENPLNINTATQEELEQLPGVGAAIAGRIIAYREEHGAFTSKEDIMLVSGIGEGIYGNIEAIITVEDTAPEDTQDLSENAAAIEETEETAQ
jgi:comEA protein